MAIRQRRPDQRSQSAATPTARARRRSGADDAWVLPIWTLIAATATLAIIVVAWLQWKTLGAVEHAMTAAQRPWLSAAVEPVKLVFDDRGGGITLKITARNTGAFPATDILASPVLLLHDAKQPFNIKKACGQFGVAGGFGLTLFKDDVFTTTTTSWLARADFSQSFPALIAVCIKYRYADRARVGETGYLFAIGNQDPTRPDLAGIDAKNGTIAPPQLALQPRGSYAY
jgi:hypothetical protein